MVTFAYFTEKKKFIGSATADTLQTKIADINLCRTLNPRLFIRLNKI